MTNEWQEYVNDPRHICKYGIKCYQKNPEHHAKYKHPPAAHNLKKRGNRNKQRFSPYRRTPSPANNAGAETDTNNEAEKNIDDVTVINKDNLSSTHDSEMATNKNDEPSTSKDCEPTNTDNNEACNTTIDPGKHNDSANISKDKDSHLIENTTFYDPTKLEVLQELFLTTMPPDFFKFYECLNEDNTIEKLLSSVNLELIGPYELLLGKLPVVDDKELYLVHWRFFYDPPEFQSLLKKKGKSEFHIGYFRDDPNEKPVFVARNDSSKDYHIKPMAENIFGAVYIYLQNEKKSSPFTSVACQKLMEKVKKYAEDNNYSLEEYSMKKRQAKIVTKTFHGAGIVVPYNKKTQLGYRHLVENDTVIKKLFTRLQAATSEKEKDSILSELQPVITYASIAMDECDFGTGLEAGIALFCSGLKELQPSALSSLTVAYSLLNREAFSKIIQAHLKYRRKGPNMSLLAVRNQ